MSKKSFYRLIPCYNVAEYRWRWEESASFMDNTNSNETYAYKRKERMENSGAHNEEGVLGEFSIHRAE